MNEKHEKAYRALSYFKHFLDFVSAFSGSVSNSFFDSIVGVRIGITSYIVEIKDCAITAGIKKYKSIIKKKKKKAQLHSVTSKYYRSFNF